MSYLALHMEKFKKEAVRGLQSHNQRERKSRSNPDILYERSGLNYDLHNAASANYQRVIDARIDSLNLKKAIRHDAVHMCGLVVSSDTVFFANLGEARTRHFFETAKEYLERFVGSENIIAAVVHMDEKTPHMHFVHVPVTPDGRLNANKIYTRESLKKLQAELPRYLQSRGFDIQRGVEQAPGAAKKHLDTREYKQQMEAVKNLQAQAAEESKNLRATREAIRHDEAGWHKKIREYEKIVQAAEAALAAKSELPSPGMFNAKVIHEEAEQIIKALKEALADKEKVKARNQALEASQASVDKQIAAAKQESERIVAEHEAEIQRLRTSIEGNRRTEKQRLTLQKDFLKILNRGLGLPEEYEMHQSMEFVLARERKEKERRAQAEKETKYAELVRQNMERRASGQSPAANPAEQEKSFTLGR